MVFPRSNTVLLLKRRLERSTAVNMRTETPARFPKSLIKAMTGLATFMLLLLLFVPLLLQSQFDSDLIAYMIYTVFLISLSVTVGMGAAWMMLSTQQPPQVQSPTQSTLAPPSPFFEQNNVRGASSITTTSLRPADEQQVIEFLRAKDGECWQSNMTRALEWTASKTSRTLAKLEYDGTVKRIRDGMGKRIVLISKEE